MAMLGWKH